MDIENRPPTRTRTRVLIAAGAVLLGATLALGGVGSDDHGGTSAGSAWLTEPAGAAHVADTFFERWVDPDGRVVRHDQGGDTVSEGQAYALLLALAAEDRDRFLTIWEWTRTNLQRSDGLLAWRWAAGGVVDPSPAADADLDTARALIAAGGRFDRPDLTRHGIRMAAAVLERETVEAGGRLVLVPGPWAAKDRIVNPSYFAPCAYAELAAATGDDGWRRLGADAVALLDSFTAGGGLPPDWARIDSTGRLVPTGPPDHPEAPPRYGLDAVRVALRFAESCPGGGDHVAARLWPRLEALPGSGSRAAYSLDGTPVHDAEHPAGLVAAAAAATAAGDGDAAAELLRRASHLDQRHPTYYGAAWLALGRLLIADSYEEAGGLSTAFPVMQPAAATSAAAEQPGTETTTSASSPTTSTTAGPPATTSTSTAPTTTTTGEATTTTTAGSVPTSSSTTTTTTRSHPAPAGSSTTSTTEPAPPPGQPSAEGAPPPAGGELSGPPPRPDRLLTAAPPPADQDAGATRPRVAALLGGLIAAGGLGMVCGIRDRPAVRR